MFSYGQWRLDFLLRSSLGNYVYNNTQSSNGSYAAISNPQFLSNMTTGIFQTGFRQNQYLSNYYVEKGSFLRMENIRFSRDFGKFLKNKIAARLSVIVQNAFIITKYSGPDPEVPNGIDYAFNPRPRTFLLSLNLGL
jgi:hypothetical protein